MLRRLVSLGLIATAPGCFAAEPPRATPPATAVVARQPAPTVTEPGVVVLAPHLDAPAASFRAPIGVVACDRYLAMVDACPADAPAREGGTKKLLDKDAPSWRELARSSTEGRLAVTFACQAALDGLRQKPCH